MEMNYGELLNTLAGLRAVGERPRVHGNGFIQLDVTPRTRLHFWSPEIPRQKVATPIHDHVFGFVSYVIDIMSFETQEQPLPTHARIRAIRAPKVKGFRRPLWHAEYTLMYAGRQLGWKKVRNAAARPIVYTTKEAAEERARERAIEEVATIRMTLTGRPSR